MGFDDILKYVNDLSGRLDHAELLTEGERTYRKYCHAVERNSQKPREQIQQTLVEPLASSPYDDSEDVFVEIERPKDSNPHPTTEKEDIQHACTQNDVHAKTNHTSAGEE